MQKVYVGLSGGVDSALSAALLKERGYDVTGVFIKIWQPEFIECTWREDRLDAMRVAAALNIPFREVDLSESYKKIVVDSMLAGYAHGRTPNPDVLCNTAIKFGAFLDWALTEGADKIATGHYARVVYADEKYHLYRGADKDKDQSYFLWEQGWDSLKYTLFPIGEMMKSEVRSLATKFGLPNARRPDSQGICFLGEVTMEEFLARFLSLEKGQVLDTAGRAVGEHHGAALYTIGQRHGFHMNGKKVPQYVIAVDIVKNQIRVSPQKDDAARKIFYLDGIHQISSTFSFPMKTSAQVRYRDTVHPCTISAVAEKKKFKVEFKEPVIAASGQSLVVYQGDRCLGGGIIC